MFLEIPNVDSVSNVDVDLRVGKVLVEVFLTFCGVLENLLMNVSKGACFEPVKALLQSGLDIFDHDSVLDVKHSFPQRLPFLLIHSRT